jgi:hypothetical protein
LIENINRRTTQAKLLSATFYLDTFQPPKRAAKSKRRDRRDARYTPNDFEVASQ